MLREILEKMTNEVMCPAARKMAEKISNLLYKGNTVKLKHHSGEFTVNSDVVMGGMISAKDSRGRWVELDLCDDSFEIA